VLEVSRRRCAGVSLVELLLVLVLAGVLMSVAMPAYYDTIRRQRLRAATADLVAAIDLTRSQAIARGSRVLMAPLGQDGTSWRQGWAVFVDDNGNRRPDPGELLIYRHDALDDGINVSSAFTSGAAQPYLAYNAAGRACSASSSLTARWGTLTLEHGGSTRNIKINMLGRVRVCDPDRDGGSCGNASD
jgi:type IV fimbrial biogenesis protein FimT